MKRVRMPSRLQREPLSLVAYDRWQDAEGLLDASPSVRRAWAAYEPTWRRERDGELRAAAEAGVTDWEPDAEQVHAANVLRAYGAGEGWCRGRGRVPRRARNREAWYAWRRQWRGHPRIALFWAWIDGDYWADSEARVVFADMLDAFHAELYGATFTGS